MPLGARYFFDVESMRSIG